MQELIELGKGAGGTAGTIIFYLIMAKKYGIFPFQPKNSNGNKYDPKYCRDQHKLIDTDIQYLKDKTKTNELRLDDGKNEFRRLEDKIDKVRDGVSEANKNIGVLIDRSKNRRATDV